MQDARADELGTGLLVGLDVALQHAGESVVVSAQLVEMRFPTMSLL